MKAKKCRVCQSELKKEPRLLYQNMPKAAQYLPDARTLNKDRGVALELCQCSGCGLVQLNSEPVPYYKEVIRAAAFSTEMRQFRAKQFSRFVLRYGLKGKNVIEIGCGRGEYLSIMQACGVNAYGLEYSAKAVKHCLKDRLKVRKVFIDRANVKLPGAPFAAFFMMSFLEHLPDPRETLAGIRNNLADGAVGLVEVPNFDLILGQNLFAEFIGDHLFYFTRDTLEMTLRLNGFTILECQPVWHDYILSAIVQKQARLDLTSFKKEQARLKNAMHHFLARFKGQKVAIWGAGHQALALIALLDLAKQIKYVIDSAPFKQGKYTPATHLRIVHPERLDSDPVKAVIVMAASYSDEVVRIIREKYGDRMGLFVIKEGKVKAV